MVPFSLGEDEINGIRGPSTPSPPEGNGDPAVLEILRFGGRLLGPVAAGESAQHCAKEQRYAGGARRKIRRRLKPSEP